MHIARTFGVLTLAFIASSCTTDETCLAWVGGGGGTDGASRAHFSNCADLREREVTCKVDGAGRHHCECVVGGTAQKKFERTEMFPQDFEVAQKTANEVCGWKLRR